MTADPVLPPEVRAAWAARGPRPAPRGELSLDRIVAASVRVADEDGLAAVSMARVAKELGFATMALYRHVSSKDELLQHMMDTALGDPPRDESRGLGWRDGLAMWTHAALAVYRRRTWILSIPIVAPPLMPKNLEWVDCALGIMAGTPLLPFEKLSTLTTLSGYARNEAALAAALPDETPEEGERSALAYERALRELTAPGHLPSLHALATSGRLFELPPDTPTEDGDAFMLEFGLERILDGVAALIAKRT